RASRAAIASTVVESSPPLSRTIAGCPARVMRSQPVRRAEVRVGLVVEARVAAAKRQAGVHVEPAGPVTRAVDALAGVGRVVADLVLGDAQVGLIAIGPEYTSAARVARRRLLVLDVEAAIAAGEAGPDQGAERNREHLAL